MNQTIVTVKARADILSVTAAPHASMSDTINNAVSLAESSLQSPLQTRDVVYTSNNDRVLNWQAPGRQVGAQPIAVMVEPSQGLAQMLQSLVAEVAEVKQSNAELKQSNAVRDEPRIRNVCAQLLRVATGTETLHSSKSTRFRSLGAGDPRIIQLAERMAVDPSQLVKQADAVIDRRNQGADAGSVEELVTDIQKVVGLITPAHEQLYRWECAFLKNYQEVIGAFEDHFSAA
eukprot:GHUV01011345.1.p1 GENE.GHUV01011345.1~~GHUV01011345.1.p1  ORF type:complete len:232 (+),score=69.05 GHUV01011345.1:178-873(+)